MFVTEEEEVLDVRHRHRGASAPRVAHLRGVAAVRGTGLTGELTGWSTPLATSRDGDWWCFGQGQVGQNPTPDSAIPGGSGSARCSGSYGPVLQPLLGVQTADGPRPSESVESVAVQNPAFSESFPESSAFLFYFFGRSSMWSTGAEVTVSYYKTC